MKKRLIAVLLTVAVLALTAAPCALAFGTADGTMAITHINEANRYEGAGIIIDGAKYERIGDLGNYAWWNVLLFDWDEEQECYVLTEKNMNRSLSARRGFISTLFLSAMCLIVMVISMKSEYILTADNVYLNLKDVFGRRFDG